MAERSRALSSRPRGLGFDPYSGRSRSAILGKLWLTLVSPFGWDVKQSIVCALSNTDFKDPDLHWGREFVRAGYTQISGKEIPTKPTPKLDVLGQFHAHNGSATYLRRLQRMRRRRRRRQNSDSQLCSPPGCFANLPPLMKFIYYLLFTQNGTKMRVDFFSTSNQVLPHLHLTWIFSLNFAKLIG